MVAYRNTPPLINRLDVYWRNSRDTVCNTSTITACCTAGYNVYILCPSAGKRIVVYESKLPATKRLSLTGQNMFIAKLLFIIRKFRLTLQT